MAAPDTKLQIVAQLVEAIATIVGPFNQSSPDCWPAINSVGNAIKIAANRAVDLSWNVVAQREATIHALTTQLDNCVNGSNFRQREFQACTTELAAAQADQAASTRLIAQQRQQLAGANQALAAANQRIRQLEAQVGKPNPCPPLLAECRAQFKDCSDSLKTNVLELTNWRDGFPGLGPKNASKQFNDALLQIRTITKERDDCRNSVVPLTNELRTATTALQQCNDRLKACNDKLLILQGQNQQCASAIVVLRGQVQACSNQITVLRGVNHTCQNQITVLVRQHNNDVVTIQRCNDTNVILRRQIATKCPPPAPCPKFDCNTLKNLVGTCNPA